MLETAPSAQLHESALDTACFICGNATGNRRHSAREMMYRTGEEFHYIECAGCGCLWLHDVPADLGPYYPSSYYSLRGTPTTWRPSPAWRRYLKRAHARYQLGNWNVAGFLAAKRFRHWAVPRWLKHADPPLDAPILDVGCGSGGGLHELNELGYTNLTGIDPFVSEDMLFSDGVQVLKRYIADHQGSYRVLIASHVLEHMPEPQATLRDFSRLVEPGGLLAISIPVAGSALWEKYGWNWVGLDAPRHLFLYNERTIRSLVENFGMKVESVVYDSSAWNFTASEGYVRDIALYEQKPEDYLSTAEIAAFAETARELNECSRSDQATFYLRKL